MFSVLIYLTPEFGQPKNEFICPEKTFFSGGGIPPLPPKVYNSTGKGQFPVSESGTVGLRFLRSPIIYPHNRWINLMGGGQIPPDTETP